MGKRYRSRSGVKLHDVTITEIPKDFEPYEMAPRSVTVYNAATVVLSEQMADVVGNRHGWNPITHTKTEFPNGGIPEPLTLRLPLVPFDREYEVTWKCEDPWIFAGNLDLVFPSSVQLNDFAWDSFLNATTQVPETIDLPNFVRELADTVKGIVIKWIGDILHFIASGFLAYEFGIAPFLKDIQTIFGLVKAAKKRLKFLRDTYGKVTDIRFKRGLTVSESSDPEALNDSEDQFLEIRPEDFPRLCTLVAHAQKSEWTLVSHIGVFHQLQGLDEADALLSTIAAMCCLQNPIKVIWNGIPFSFVLEYFVNLRHFFDNLQLPPFKGVIALRYANWSMRAENAVECYSEKWRANIVTSEEEGTHVSYVFYKKKQGRCRNTYYHRRPGLPLGAEVFLTEGLTNMQLALLAALIYTNGRE
jgi:hypothetical protein